MIVDAQVHIWAADTPERPWVPGQAARAHRPVPLSHEGLLQEMAQAGVDRAILVPPSYEGDRNDLVLAAARAHPDRFAAMGRLPIEDRRSEAQLARWREQPGMLGLRLTFHLPQQRRWLEDGTVDWFWPAAEKAGLPLMILPTGSLPAMRDIATRHPGLRIVIDHCSMHRVAGHPFRIDPAEMDYLAAMAELPNVAVKLSALPLFSNEPYPFRDIHGLIRQMVQAYGPRRSFWGSDMTRLPCTYRQCLTLFTEELPWLSEDDKAWILGRGLCEWLGWRG
ncbi:amidohydrolase family protein [Pigmentiphaga soli]|uniref:Amidohydrolase family protein n=1 Tax=Pigmentiphaga soli TaxID=1007095 RepID=A0ABP8HN14_9BURK